MATERLEAETAVKGYRVVSVLQVISAIIPRRSAASLLFSWVNTPHANPTICNARMIYPAQSLRPSDPTVELLLYTESLHAFCLFRSTTVRIVNRSKGKGKQNKVGAVLHFLLKVKLYVCNLCASLRMACSSLFGYDHVSRVFRSR